MSFTDGFFEWFYWINDGGVLKIFDQVNNVMPNELGFFIALCLFVTTILLIVLGMGLVIFTVTCVSKYFLKIYLKK
jgi:hypothetical protein